MINTLAPILTIAFLAVVVLFVREWSKGDERLWQDGGWGKMKRRRPDGTFEYRPMSDDEHADQQDRRAY